jgi:hypothetical protein
LLNRLRSIFNYSGASRRAKLDRMNGTGKWARILVRVGSIAMLVGALDPLEGSLLILPGSGLVALGTILNHGELRLLSYRVGVFILIALGVGALWWLSMLGGFGGTSGRSNLWGLLILPYLAGWLMGILGPGSPRWTLWLGIGVGLWYMSVGVMLSNRIGCILLSVGMLTTGGCIWRLLRQETKLTIDARQRDD